MSEKLNRFFNNDIERRMKKVGAEQLYFEETGKKPVADGVYTPEAKAYINALLAQLQTGDLAPLQKGNPELEKKIQDAFVRSLKEHSKSIESGSEARS